jgi:type II secretory pathway component PulC
VLVLASFLVLYAVGNTLFNWHADYVLDSMPVATVSAESAASAEATLIAALPSQHIFGWQSNEDTDFLPITNLQLHLTGVLKDANDNSSQVIISEAGQPGKIYGVGDVLTDGIKIYGISDDGIVLEHGGRLEKLPLDRPRLQFQDKPNSLWQDN